MSGILPFLYMVFFLVIVIREIVFIHKQYDILLMYALIYALVPFTLLTIHNNGGDVGNYLRFDSDSTLLAMFAFSLIGYCLIDFGYKVKIKRYKKERVRTIESQEVLTTTDKEVNRLTVLSIILTLLSLVSLYLWSRAYGGPFKMMAYASLIRSGYDTTKNGLAFFKNPANLCTMGSYVSFLCLIQNKQRNRALNLLLLVLNIYAKILYSLIDDGRMNAVIYFVGFVAIYYYFKLNNREIKLRTVASRALLIAIVSFFLMVFASTIMDRFRYNSNELTFAEFDFSSSLVKEFRYTFSDLYTSIGKRWNGFEYTFFRNILSGLFAYFPTALKPEYAKVSLTKINSINVYGEAYSNHSGSPPDFLSVAIYDVGFVGIILYPIILGILLRILDEKFRYYKKDSVFGMTVYLCLLFRIARIIPNASMYNVILSLFYIVISSLLYYMINRVSVGR